MAEIRIIKRQEESVHEVSITTRRGTKHKMTCGGYGYRHVALVTTLDLGLLLWGLRD